MDTNFEAYVRRRVRRQVGKRAALSSQGRRNVAWIEAHQSLLNHRKTNRAIALLKCDRHKFIGHMFQLWWWCLDNAPDGNFGDLLPGEIAVAAGWSVKTGDAFVKALIASGFFDEDGDDALSLHNWGRYTDRLMAKREAGRKGGVASGESRRDSKQTGEVLEANEASALTPTNQPHSTSPTDQQNQPTNLARERLRGKLTLAPEEWTELIAKHGSSVHARYWEWVDWIGESEGERMPTKTAFLAFRGFLEKGSGRSKTSAAAAR